MTVAAKPATATYLEDGASVSFPVPFRFKSSSDLIVERLLAGGGVQRLALGTDYTATGGTTDAGGMLSRTVATAGATLRIRRETARAQPMTYSTGDRFPAASHEEALDRQMLIAQELDATAANLNRRALMVPDGEVLPDLPALADRLGGAKKILAIDQDTGAIRVEPIDATYRGSAGPAANSRQTLTDLKAAAITDLTSLYDGSLWTWTPGNFMGRADDVNIVKADGVFLFDGAWVRQLADQVYLRNFGADPTGATSSNGALARAYAAGRIVLGAPGDVYLLDGAGVVSPSNRKLIGNGASLKIAPGATGIRLTGEKCEVADWTIIGNGGLYAVQNTGKSNKFTDNDCTGNIGHFFFSSDAKHVKATGNYIDGRSADVEITTAIIAERSKHITITDNRSEDIPVGWCIQVRDGSEKFTVNNNNILQTKYFDTKVSTADQKVFSFTLQDQLGRQSPCFLKKIQINGLPLSTGYTVIGNGPSYMVTFSKGRVAGEAVRLVGYRGAENIQINSASRNGTITGNTIDGTADSGIIVHGSRITVSGNEVSNCGYVGIAIYGDQDHIAVTGNNISDCAQMDDGMSSPDFPDLPSVFAGGILISGNNVTATGNTVTNTTVINGRGSMRYGIRFNKSDMPLRTDGTATMTATGNSFSGGFVDGQRYAPQDTTGQRVKSISVDGVRVEYGAKIGFDSAWVQDPDPTRPNQLQPADVPDYIKVGGSSDTRAMRDLATKRGGTASLRTVAGQYIDFDLTSASTLYGCNVEVTFWAKANGGASYFTVFTTLAGLRSPISTPITDTNWRHYTISFPFVRNLEESILLRMGADSESANFQHIQISGVRL